MTSPFAAPAAAAGFRPEDYNGRLLLITPHKVEEGVKTAFGEKDAIRCDVVVLDGNDPGEEHADTLIFGLVLIGQLRSKLGQRVLGRLGQGIAKAGQKPPWKLSEATDADQQTGLAYLNRTSLASPASAAAPPF
jgi:hypothetical protein